MAPDERFTDPEDEDLFDFPAVDHPLSGSLDTVSGGGAALELDELDIDELGAVLGEELAPEDDPIFDAEPVSALPVDPDPEPAFEEDPRGLEPEPASAAPTTMSQGDEMPDDLDADLFNFDASFLVQLSKDLKGGSQDKPVAKAEQPAPKAAPKKAKAAPVDSPSPEQAATESAQEEAAPAKQRRRRPTAEELAELDDVFDMDVPRGTLVPLGHEEGPRNRVVELLAVGFIVINTGILLLAWRAGSQFQETLLQVTQTLGSSGGGRVEASVPTRPVIDEPLVLHPATEARPVPTPAPEVETQNQDPHDLDDLPRITLRAAAALIDQGQFESARQRVFHLLANRDRYALADELVTEGEILIARSTQLQGHALQEVGR